MTFFITRVGQGNVNIFLVDRSKTKSKWWTTEFNEAMQFKKESAANIQCNKLRFGEPYVVAAKIAFELSNENDYIIADNESQLGWDAHKNYR